MTDDNAYDEAACIVEKYLAGRQWLRCTVCGELVDAQGDSSAEWCVRVDAGEIIAVLCLLCSDARQ